MTASGREKERSDLLGHSLNTPIVVNAKEVSFLLMNVQCFKMFKQQTFNELQYIMFP